MLEVISTLSLVAILFVLIRISNSKRPATVFQNEFKYHPLDVTGFVDLSIGKFLAAEITISAAGTSKSLSFNGSVKLFESSTNADNRLGATLTVTHHCGDGYKNDCVGFITPRNGVFTQSEKVFIEISLDRAGYEVFEEISRRTSVDEGTSVNISIHGEPGLIRKIETIRIVTLNNFEWENSTASAVREVL